MRTQIKVTDLNLRQWEYVATKVPVNGREFLGGLPRVCVVFELTEDISEIHIEMDLIELTGLLVVLEGVRNEPATSQVAAAVLTPDALPEHLNQMRDEADPARVPEVWGRTDQ